MKNLIILALALSSPFVSAKNLRLEKAENTRILMNGVLELGKSIPKGSLVWVADDVQPENHDFRNSKGEIERSSNGFYPRAVIKTVPASANWSQETIDDLNKKDLWITATIVPEETSATFSPVIPGTLSDEYLANFESTGKPKFGWSPYFQTRFGDRLNHAFAEGELSNAEMTKSTKIFNELRVAFDRSVATPTTYLYMDKAEAKDASIAYENNGVVQDHGAWTIAVLASAVRHGFPNVPCAEFMSEMIKQAYKRAGYDVFADFNIASGTYLGWDTTSAVVTLANTLVKAGWIPWELATYKVPTGAIMTHFRATSPGHAYGAGGFDGQIIVDNGSPAGRKLGATTRKIIEMMYLGGVFFLPPGITPEKW